MQVSNNFLFKGLGTCISFSEWDWTFFVIKTFLYCWLHCLLFKTKKKMKPRLTKPCQCNYVIAIYFQVYKLKASKILYNCSNLICTSKTRGTQFQSKTYKIQKVFRGYHKYYLTNQVQKGSHFRSCSFE